MLTSYFVVPIFVADDNTILHMIVDDETSATISASPAGAVITTGYLGGADGDVPYAKGGINSNAAAPLEITFTSSDEKTAQDKAQMEQNALPVWHTQSTVSGELGLREAAARKEREGFLGKAVEDTAVKKASEGAAGGAEVDAIQEYYAAMAAQKAQEEAEEEEGEEEEEEEEEEQEEDVVTTPAVNGTGTGAFLCHLRTFKCPGLEAHAVDCRTNSSLLHSSRVEKT